MYENCTKFIAIFDPTTYITQVQTAQHPNQMSLKKSAGLMDIGLDGVVPEYFYPNPNIGRLSHHAQVELMNPSLALVELDAPDYPAQELTTSDHLFGQIGADGPQTSSGTAAPVRHSTSNILNIAPFELMELQLDDILDLPEEYLELKPLSFNAIEDSPEFRQESQRQIDRLSSKLSDWLDNLKPESVAEQQLERNQVPILRFLDEAEKLQQSGRLNDTDPASGATTARSAIEEMLNNYNQDGGSQTQDQNGFNATHLDENIWWNQNYESAKLFSKARTELFDGQYHRILMKESEICTFLLSSISTILTSQEQILSETAPLPNTDTKLLGRVMTCVRKLNLQWEHDKSIEEQLKQFELEIRSCKEISTRIVKLKSELQEQNLHLSVHQPQQGSTPLTQIFRELESSLKQLKSLQATDVERVAQHKALEELRIKLENENIQHKQLYETTKETLDTVNGEKKLVDDELRTVKAELEGKKAKIEIIMVEVENWRSNCAQQEALIQQKLAELSRLEGDLQDHKQQLASSHSQNMAYRDQLEEMHSTIKELKMLVAERDQIVAQQKRLMEEQIAKNNQLKSEKQTLEEKVAELTTHVTQLKTQLDVEVNKVASLEEKCRQQANEIQQKTLEIETLQREKSLLETKCAQQATLIEEKKQLIVKLEAEKAQLELRCVQQATTIAEQQQVIADLRHQKALLEQENQNLARTITEQGQTISKLRQEIEDLENKRLQLERALEAERLTNKDLCFKIDLLQRNLEDEQKKLVAEQEKNCKLVTELAQIHQKLEDAENTIRTQRIEISSLKAQVSSLESQLASLNRTIDNLRADITRLKQELNGLRSQIENLSRELEVCQRNLQQKIEELRKLRLDWDLKKVEYEDKLAKKDKKIQEREDALGEQEQILETCLKNTNQLMEAYDILHKEKLQCLERISVLEYGNGMNE